MLAFLNYRYDEASRAWQRASEDPSIKRDLATWVLRLPPTK